MSLLLPRGLTAPRLAVLVALAFHSTLPASPPAVNPPVPEQSRQPDCGGDADLLIERARIALGRRDFDEAEKLARTAEETAGQWHWWSPLRDSPSKVLKDVAKARRSTPATPSVAPGEPARFENIKKNNVIHRIFPGNQAKAVETTTRATSQGAPNAVIPVGTRGPLQPPPLGEERTGIPNDEAHKLLKDARRALNEDRLEDARKLLSQACETRTNYRWSELWWDPDQPDRVEADLRRAQSKRCGGGASANVGASLPVPRPPLTRDEARTRIKVARDWMKTGNLNEAEKVACQVRETAPRGYWGLFDDSPDKVVLDLRKMKARRDRDESDRLLAEARKALQEGHLDDAREKAARAEKLHGPYNVWEFGDRPQRLMGEITLAEAKAHRSKPTPASPKEETVVAKAPELVPVVPNPVGPTPTDTVPTLSPPGAVVDARTLEARKLLADARAALRENNLALATQLATQVQLMGVAQDRLGSDTPDSVLQDITRLREQPGTAVVTLPARPAAPDPITIRAREVLADARRLQADGKLVEAREKALDGAEVRRQPPGRRRPTRACVARAGRTRPEAHRTSDGRGE